MARLVTPPQSNANKGEQEKRKSALHPRRHAKVAAKPASENKKRKVTPFEKRMAAGVLRQKRVAMINSKNILKDIEIAKNVLLRDASHLTAGFPIISVAEQVRANDNALETGMTGAKDEGFMHEAQKELLNRTKDRPDLAVACLKFLDGEVTRPEYAKLSAELTEARLEKTRKMEREKKARYRQRVRATATAEPM